MVSKRHYSYNMLSDIETVGRAIDGDEKAYASLLEKYQISIYYLLLKKVGNENDAEDLTIETFTKAFNNLDQYTPVYAFSTWLFRIAVNHSIDFTRKKKIRPIPYNNNGEFNDPEALILTSTSPNPEDLVIKEQNAKQLKDVIKKLKPRYAKIIELRYYKEMSYEEISEELKIPIGSVKAQLFRARELLAPMLKNKINSSNNDY